MNKRTLPQGVHSKRKSLHGDLEQETYRKHLRTTEGRRRRSWDNDFFDSEASKTGQSEGGLRIIDIFKLFPDMPCMKRV